MKGLWKQWNEAMLEVGMPAIQEDTCARIFAVIYVHGNNEAFTSNERLLADIEYIQKRFRVSGGEVPDINFASLVRRYVRELEDYEREHVNKRPTTALFASHIPQWARDLFMNRYGIKLIN